GGTRLPDATACWTALAGDGSGRRPEAAELAAGHQAAPGGSGRPALADVFWPSPKQAERLAGQSSAGYPGSGAGGPEDQAWAGALLAPRRTPEQVAQAIRAADECFARATRVV